MVLYEIYRKDGGNGITFVHMLYSLILNEGFLYFINEGFLYFVNEGFLYFINEGFLYFVNKMILTSHKPGDITFNNNL
jgi:type IV secretory pathway VirB4 component